MKTLSIKPMAIIFFALLILALIGIAHLYTSYQVSKPVAMPTTSTMQWSTDTCRWGNGWK